MKDDMKVDRRRKTADRRYFLGGSDARIIMGSDEAALFRLWLIRLIRCRERKTALQTMKTTA